MRTITIISNLFPTPWDPLRASFNKQQFERLSEHYTINMVVPVPWYIFFRKKTSTSVSTLNTKYIPFFYIPGLLRFLNPIFLLISLIIGLFPYKGLIKSDLFLLSWAYPDAVAGTILAKLFNKKTIVKIHGSDINEFLIDTKKRIQIKWALSRSHKIISVSQALINKLTQIGIPNTKTTCIYNGVNHEIFRPLDKSTCRTTLNINPINPAILFIGNLKKAKGCIEFINAVSKIRQSGQDISAYIIGSGSIHHELKELIHTNKATGYIHLIGPVSHELLPSWINACDIFCLPSYMEGVPNVVLEAISCGKPCVASNIGGIPEILPESCGILIEAKNTTSLVSGIKQAIDTSWNATDIVEYSRLFNWDKNISQLISTIEETL